MQCCIAFGVFAKLRVFDQRQGYWLSIHFHVDSSHAGRAIERSQRSQNEGQRLHWIWQTADPSFLNLDRPRAHDPLRRIQIQTESPA